MKINPAKHTVCEKGHMYRHKKHDSCPVCENEIKQKIKAALTPAQHKLLMCHPLTYSFCNIHSDIYKTSQGCPSCHVIPDHYCGKMMYTEGQAKERIRKSKGELRGYYFCQDCDAFHTTKQQLTPSRIEWYKNNPKKYRNKHL